MAGDLAPSFRPYRYAKGCLVADCPSCDGFKTRAARLAEFVGARYVNRARGYVLSESKARKLRALYEAGKDACYFTRELSDA